METHIINPWMFYWIEVLDGFSIFMTIITIIFTLTVAGLLLYCLITYADNYEYGEDDRDVKQVKKMWGTTLKRVIPIYILSLMITIGIPSEQTIYKMMAADMITQENIQKAGQSVDQLIGYIVDKVEEVKSESE